MKRLPAAFYRGPTFIHWNMAIDDRLTGWLTPLFHRQFRELQLHALCRYRLLGLTYCLMPDHLHLLWAGLAADSDQDRAASFLRKYLNIILASPDGTESRSAPNPNPRSGIGNDSVRPSPRPFRLQKQTWDVVLLDNDQSRDALERLLFYIAENPVRAGLVTEARDWPYCGSQAAGYPDLDWRAADFRERLWKICGLETERNAG